MGSPLRGYSGCVLQVKGECTINVTYKGQAIQLPLVVITARFVGKELVKLPKAGLGTT